MSITNPPIFEHYLLENPYPVCGTLVVTAVVLFIISRRRINTRMFIGSLVAAVLAGGVYLLASGIETDREHLTRLVHRGVRCTATSPMDIPTLRTMVAAGATLTGPDDEPGQLWVTSEEMFAVLESLDQDRVILGQGVDDVVASTPQQGEGLTRVDLRTIIKTELGDQLVKTRWLLQWSQTTNDQWTVNRIRWLKHPAPNALQPSHKVSP